MVMAANKLAEKIKIAKKHVDILYKHLSNLQGSTLSFLAGCPKSHFLG